MSRITAFSILVDSIPVGDKWTRGPAAVTKDVLGGSVLRKLQGN